MRGLKGKTVLVTAGASGIGQATANARQGFFEPHETDRLVRKLAGHLRPPI